MSSNKSLDIKELERPVPTLDQLWSLAVKNDQRIKIIEHNLERINKEVLWIRQKINPHR